MFEFERSRTIKKKQRIEWKKAKECVVVVGPILLLPLAWGAVANERKMTLEKYANLLRKWIEQRHQKCETPIDTGKNAKELCNTHRETQYLYSKNYSGAALTFFPVLCSCAFRFTGEKHKRFHCRKSHSLTKRVSVFFFDAVEWCTHISKHNNRMFSFRRQRFCFFFVHFRLFAAADAFFFFSFRLFVATIVNGFGNTNIIHAVARVHFGAIEHHLHCILNWVCGACTLALPSNIPLFLLLLPI